MKCLAHQVFMREHDIDFCKYIIIIVKYKDKNVNRSVNIDNCRKTNASKIIFYNSKKRFNFMLEIYQVATLLLVNKMLNFGNFSEKSKKKEKIRFGANVF